MYRVNFSDTYRQSEHSIAVDKLSANWQSRTSSVEMSYYITAVFPALFLSSVLIFPLHPCLHKSSARLVFLGFGLIQLHQLIKLLGSLLRTSPFPPCLTPSVPGRILRDPVTLTGSVLVRTTQSDRDGSRWRDPRSPFTAQSLPSLVRTPPPDPSPVPGAKPAQSVPASAP